MRRDEVLTALHTLSGLCDAENVQDIGRLVEKLIGRIEMHSTITVVELRAEEVIGLAKLFDDAGRRGWLARVAIDRHGFKVSIMRGGWTPAIGTIRP